MTTIQLIKGFKDILPGETELWQHIETTAQDIFKNFNFKEIRLPVLEHSELFARSIGTDTDIVEKEMYTFPDRKGDLLTMRPEATASVVRAYIQHKLYAKDPVQKVYSIGPMFRRERPQKGRYRQFYQINAEVFGIASPLIDAQLIFMLTTIFSKLNITDIVTHINSLGCPECRPGFKKALLTFLSSVSDKLCSDCTRRHKRNPLRVLDCKVPSCKDAISNAPAILDFLCPECKDHFNTVKKRLDTLKIPYIVNNNMVRGLDYYTRTTFEIQTGSLGAQSAVAGGGRYDGLVEALGGPDHSAIGFAIGLDRLAEIKSAQNDNFVQHPEIFIAALGDYSRTTALELSCHLGLEGIRTELNLNDRSLKSQMKRANRLGASHVLIVGEDELKQGAVIMRNMNTKNQVSIPVQGLVENIKKVLKTI
ncbi:MAG: histidine--tRNA ligase [Desulfosarcina sp.]|nr:histidine--tRNA ligase [Desulfobacterales bacterium]